MRVTKRKKGGRERIENMMQEGNAERCVAEGGRGRSCRNAAAQYVAIRRSLGDGRNALRLRSILLLKNANYSFLFALFIFSRIIISFRIRA